MTTEQFTADNTEGYTAADLDALNAEFERACMELDIDADDAEKSLLDALAERILALYDEREAGGERWHAITAYNSQPIDAWGTEREVEQYLETLNANRIVNVYNASAMAPGSAAALELSARLNDALNLRDELSNQQEG